MCPSPEAHCESPGWRAPSTSTRQARPAMSDRLRRSRQRCPKPVSTGDGNRLIGRLLLRQLYGYPATDPTVGSAPTAKDKTAKDQTLSGPVPDLASAQPKLSKDGLTATITLRPVRWDVPSGRRVTSTDELRALKRLCLPSINSPVSGYLAESVVGFARACAGLAVSPPATLAALDAVSIAGLSIEGDNTLVVRLLRPTNDLTAIFSLPETSPLPVESFTGLRVTNDPNQFVGDGPYRFVDAQSGETYALSRSPSWDPGQDPLRRAYIDHVSIRGGLTAAQVTAEVSSGAADLSLDVPVAASLASSLSSRTLMDTPARAAVLLAIGVYGRARVRLSVPGVRQVISSCIDTATRTRVVTALGDGLASSADDLLTGLSLDPSGRRPVAPSAVSSPSPSPSGASASPSDSSGSPSPSPSASPSPALPTAPCVPTFGVNGAALTMLTLDAPATRAAAAVVAARLAVAGVNVTIRAVAAAQYASLSESGGWDLLLALRPVRYPAPRALLAPLLDPSWPGPDALAPSLSRTYAMQLLAAVAGTEKTSTLKAWDALDARLDQAATLIPIALLNGVYARGPNVANEPTVPTFSNADPTNVALGSTRVGDPARSATSTP